MNNHCLDKYERVIRIPKNDMEYSRQRLERILNRRRLLFNPYTVSDKKLLEIAWQTDWGTMLDITEIVILTFTRLHKVADFREFDGIFIRVGRAQEEIFLKEGALTNWVTAVDTRKGERHSIGKRVIRNYEDLKYLVGKTVFVSHVIRGVTPWRTGQVVYRMHRLCGKTERDAITIRNAMCAAKIEMLERLMANPENPDTLDCSPGFFDYVTPITKIIELIKTYPLTPVPKD